MKDVLPKLNEEDKLVMQKLLKDGSIKHKYAKRIQTVLKRDEGRSVGEIADSVGIAREMVSSYVNRYNQYGIDFLLKDKTRKPGKAPISEELKNEICRTACKEKPLNATHWSTRELGKKFGIAKSTVNIILRERDIKPHLINRFQYSTDEHFTEKLTDVVGLYMNPPKNAIIYCVDEKSQIQALERTQPILPILPPIREKQTVDYFRHGTTTLFAALDYLSGNVIGECSDTHNAGDYIAFLKKLDKKSPKGKELHIIADNYAAHKTKEVRDYIASGNGRFVEHFIPTHSSWLNLIERWFAGITNKRIRRESWESVEQLVKAIKVYIKDWNKTGKPFKWTKNAGDIISKIDKGKNAYI
jgi:transposase